MNGAPASGFTRRALALVAWMAVVICGASVPVSALTPQTQAPPLPAVVVTELKVLGETYALLDALADKVWPGWSGYREVPFLFEFENNLRVLVGHPNPPKPFELVPGLTIGGHSVSADRSRVSAVALTPPFSGGGGPNDFGTTTDGKPVHTVMISLRSARTSEAPVDAAKGGTEEKVLIYLHELFHCYQTGHVEAKAGNLRFNPDAEFATWSQVEGIALERAYLATDPTGTRQHLEEFIVARSLKRRSMSEEQRAEESADDLREGTATYVMLRALELLKDGSFRPALTAAEDPTYHGFANREAMIADYLDHLRQDASRHEDPKMKCYHYGCFQAALSARLFPGWQKDVEASGEIDGVIEKRLAMTGAQRAAAESRLRRDYPVDTISASARQFTEPRDAAYSAISARKGRTYIVDVKAIRTFLDTLVTGKTARSYRLGLLSLYPAGFPGFTIDAVTMSPVSVPMNTDQLYYVKVVDTEWQAHKTPFAITGTPQPDGSYTNATVTTPLFTLQAPRVKVVETGNRVKIRVLERVAPRG